jgi:Xaa-Pro aminopeptidase
LNERLKSVRLLLQSASLDAVVFFGLPNIRYLSGFTGTDGVFVVTREVAVFLTDSRYEQQAQIQVCADRVICYQTKFSGIAEFFEENKCLKIGFDAAALSVAQFETFKAAVSAPIEWRPLNKQLLGLRQIKDADELNSIRQAAGLNRRALEAVLPLFKPGVSERYIALELEIALKRFGGEANAFDFIVASGERGALPHGVASEKLLSAGDLVTIDFGTQVGGYHSDETVTLAIGECDGKLRQIFDIVLEAHDSAIASVKPGMAIADLDAVARDLIAAAGYGDYFGHGLGHGVGLEIHEQPTVSPRSSDVLCAGMVITIEPGIYLPGSGGVRIEDMVVVTDTGCEVLTSIPKGFRSLPLE